MDATWLQLATQAGFVSRGEVESAFSSDDLLKDLLNRVRAEYKGTLDAYAVMFLAYNEAVLHGHSPRRNDSMDLEFFKYLDAYGRPLSFVTPDSFWPTLARSALPGRVLSFDEFVVATAQV
jgi:hypothetical protein